MKNLIFINGTMGVGKTATSRELQKLLPECVFLDGDWCWDMSPFVITDETKKMVLNNICYLLNSFLACSEFENILFCWVMQEQWIIDELLSRLNNQEYRFVQFTLNCSQNALTERIEDDIQKGAREPESVARSLSYLSRYALLHTVKIDVSDITAEQAAKKVFELIYLMSKTEFK